VTVAGTIVASIDMERVVALAQLACLLEVQAPKPGNVSPGRGFRDMSAEDFMVSALALGPAFLAARQHPLGKIIRQAVETGRRWTATNTNLGLVLLLAPLVKAVAHCLPAPERLEALTLRSHLRQVLAATSVEDARDVYAAIRSAAPGGLGLVTAEDVSADPTVDLATAMRLARDRDTIAREYDTGFKITFGLGAPALSAARRDGLDWPDAIVETFLTLLAAQPDTHIARRGGVALAEDVSRGAQDVLRHGGVRRAAGRRVLAEFDCLLRDDTHLRNPGTTADLTAAALFVVLLASGWQAERTLP
jgi:triphosphoribosyl-dephospho-CoA synthase